MFFKCNSCTELFSRRDYLKRHVREYHEGKKVKHYNCSKDCNHKECDATLPAKEMNGIVRKIKARTFGNVIREIRFIAKEEIIHPFCFFECVHRLVEDTLEKLRKENGNYKIVTKLCVQFQKRHEIEIKDESYFSVQGTHLSNYNFDKISSIIDSKIESFTERTSKWIISKTLFLELQVCKTNL